MAGHRPCGRIVLTVVRMLEWSMYRDGEKEGDEG